MIYAFIEMYDFIMTPLFEALNTEKRKVIADSARAIAGQSIKANPVMDYG